MAEWRNNRMGEWGNGGMVEWRNGGMVEWRNGGMAEWQNGGMAEWHNVRYKIVWNQDMESTQMPPWQSPSRLVNQQKVLVFDNNNIKRDIILCTNFLSKTGIKLNYPERNINWFDCSISLRPPGGLVSKEFDAMEDMFHIQVKDKLFGEDWLKCFATEILDAKYERMDVVEVVKGLTHSNACCEKV